MKQLSETTVPALDAIAMAPPTPGNLTLPALLGEDSNGTLMRMFRDPRVLEEHERLDLIARLRQAVELAPAAPEVRVLLGMALSVNLDAQEAMEELREAVRIAPDSFIAQLKFGELLMRLRVCDQAEEHTHAAAKLASNAYQSDLARKQAATIRTMRREGVERGGFQGMFSRLTGLGRKAKQQSTVPVLVGSK